MTDKTEAHDKYYKLLIWSLKFLGCWPNQSLALRRTIGFAFLSCELSVMLPQLCALPGLWKAKEIESFFVSLLLLMFCNACFAEYIISYNSISQIRILYNYFINDWKTIKIEEELEILNKWSVQGRFMVIFYAVAVVAMGYSVMIISEFGPYVLNIVKPLENKTRLPITVFYGKYYFFDEMNWIYATHLHIFVMSLANAILMNTIIMLDVISVHHICGLMNIVNYRLEHMDTFIDTANYKADDRVTVTKNIDKYSPVFEYLKRTAAIHSQALKCPDLLESVISYSFFVIELTSVIALAMLLYFLVRIADNLGKAAQSSTLSSCLVIFFFYMNWNGQLVANNSEKVFYATYFNEWYVMSQREKMMIKFMMQRSIEPIHISAGKVLELSLQSFASLLKATASYVTILMSFQ